MKKKSSKQKKAGRNASSPTSSRGSQPKPTGNRGTTRTAESGGPSLRARDEDRDHQQIAAPNGGPGASRITFTGNGPRGYREQNERQTEEYERTSGRFAPADEDYDNMEAAIENEDLENHDFEVFDRADMRDRGQNSQALHHPKR